MKHTKECIESQKRQQAWLEKHPHYCTTCGGAGEIRTPQTWEEPEDAYLCECFENGICPLCASTLIFDKETGETAHCSNPECELSKKTLGAETEAPDWETLPDVDCWCWEEGNPAKLIEYPDYSGWQMVETADESEVA